MKFRKLLFKSYGIFLIICFSSFSPSNGGNKKLEYIDRVYEANIKTPILYHADDAKFTPLQPAAIPIFQQIPLRLKFDEIYTDEADYYRAKLIHCNANWTPSQLSDLQFLYEYNEFNIEEFDFSIATKVPYTHFTFTIPRVKLPGNYLLVIYREPDEMDIIISKRFIVFDPRIRIVSNIGLSAGVSQRRNNQQIELAIDYTSFPIPNPYLDIKVMIKQNHRWDNAIYDLRPTMVKEDIKQIEYRHFNLENNFRAGNEFRFFDIRSVNFGGRNVEKMTSSSTRVDAYLYFDKSRGTEPYSLYRDLNGGFVIENSEGRDNMLESDYISVHFFLDLKGKTGDEIFIAGKLTDWAFDQKNNLKYVETSGLYMGNLLLKQGIYDFIYYIPKNDENPYNIEGNHFETNNEYEVIVYYRDPSMNTDFIIGYQKF
jgi:hypothetical protein